MLAPGWVAELLGSMLRSMPAGYVRLRLAAAAMVMLGQTPGKRPAGVSSYGGDDETPAWPGGGQCRFPYRA